jgi:hypothetical protein
MVFFGYCEGERPGFQLQNLVNDMWNEPNKECGNKQPDEKFLFGGHGNGLIYYLLFPILGVRSSDFIDLLVGYLGLN